MSRYISSLVVIFQSTLPVRGATFTTFKMSTATEFQSTLPVRGATNEQPELFKQFTISIHAPRAGSDGKSPLEGGGYLYFNPRSPCGERLVLINSNAQRKHISIHAPRAGSDSNILCFCKLKAQYILNQLF